jgi:nicotinamide-nucleotide amidase
MGRELLHQPAIETHIRDFFASIGKIPPASVYRQAMVPAGAEVLHNAHGTAPGLLLKTERAQVFLLPGPPNELKPMWQDIVLPRIRQAVGVSAIHASAKFLIGGIGESAVQERAENSLHQLVPGIDIAYCASLGKVELRLTHPDRDQLNSAAAWLRGEFKRAIQTEGGTTLEEGVVRLATEKSIKLSTAESCTGGLVAHRLTNISGASAVMERGWVTYSNEAKINCLGVPAELISSHGAVSPEVAQAMARGALENSLADIAVSLTGVAGPTGGTPEKPVGLVYLGLAFRSKNGNNERIISRCIKKHLVPERETFKNMASDVALDLFRRRLLNWKKPE